MSTETSVNTHTPGPWAVDVSLPGIVEIRDSEKRMLATVYAPDYLNHPVTDEEAEANARLIALAPELLEALEEMVESFWSECIGCVRETFRENHPDHLINKWEGVIRKAGGDV